MKSIPLADADDAGLKFNEVEPGHRKLRVQKRALMKNIKQKIGNIRVSPQRHGLEPNYVAVPKESTPEKIVSLEKASQPHTLINLVGRSPSP